MLHFVVVWGDRGAVAAASRRLLDALAATRLFDGAQLQHVAPSGTWAVHGFGGELYRGPGAYAKGFEHGLPATTR